jgi:hypothetical protein
MVKGMDFETLADRLRLLLKGRGPLAREEICRELSLSQPSFSRLLAVPAAAEVLRMGRARRSTYAWRRDIPQVGRSTPLYAVNARGKTEQIATLHAFYPRGFWFEPRSSAWPERMFEDLPYFLDELRPSGFLGRLVPRLHPDLGCPPDVRDWTVDHALSYVTRYGWDGTGNLILGEQAFRLFLARQQNPPAALAARARAKAYDQLATDILQMREVGSSAGGEQAKFTARLQPGGQAVLVKFSPPRREALGRRGADLLVAEHLALEALRRHGLDAAESTIVEGKERTFLEVVRFDRLVGGGRRGMVSLRMLDAEFTGHAGTWSKIAEALERKRIVTPAVRERIERAEMFGQLIGNSDRHAGNISFFWAGPGKPVDLTPIYDMLPMMYFPQQNQLVAREFAPALPVPAELPAWQWALPVAQEFWARVGEDRRVSPAFRKIAAANGRELGRLAKLASRVLV